MKMKHKARKYILRGRTLFVALCTIYILGMPFMGKAQVLTLADAQKTAEQSSGRIQAAMIAIESEKMREKTAFNLDQPQLQVQAPTGNFYVLGVQQNFDSPSVYAARKKVLQSQSQLAGAQAALVTSEVKYMIADLYVQWQTAEARLAFLSGQLLDYTSISDAAVRSFEAGEIDALEKSFAELKFQEAKRQVELLQSERDAVKNSIVGYLSMDGNVTCDSLGSNLQIIAWETVSVNSATIAMAEAEARLSEQELKLQKRQNLPGFFLGYMNQGERNSNYSNRFNGGISIPLWFWHTTAARKAAKLDVDKSQKELLAAQQQMNQLFNSALVKHQALMTSVSNMRIESLPIAETLIVNAKRMYDAGEISITEYLRLRSDAGQTKLAYIDLLQDLTQMQNQLHYITSVQ